MTTAFSENAGERCATWRVYLPERRLNVPLVNVSPRPEP
jgi:hypothetical protein